MVLAKSGPAQHARVRRIMRKVLRAWPVPLRGYDYSVSVARTEMPNAFAYGDGRLGFTTGMLDGVGMTDAEVEMIMAHEVAHTELRHSNRMRKVVLRGQMINAAALGRERAASRRPCQRDDHRPLRPSGRTDSAPHGRAAPRAVPRAA